MILSNITQGKTWQLQHLNNHYSNTAYALCIDPLYHTSSYVVFKQLLVSLPVPPSDQAKRVARSRRKTWQQCSDFCQGNPSEADRTICSQAWPTHVSLHQTAPASLLCATQVSNSLSNDFPVSFTQTKHVAPLSR